ncbi:MAG: HNH endonuclease [Thermoplasmata archaeon]|nr:HNH endonuclease [Thermoplasmata archaeon]
MNENIAKVIVLYNGIQTSTEIAKAVGLSPRYVRKIATRFDLDRLPVGARCGNENHSFVSGRRIDRDGYVMITVPGDHPYARPRPGRNGKLMLEHRMIMEQEIGRYLLPSEIVDHRDGLTLHNAPLNLRLFASNGDHLSKTTTGNSKLISKSGRQNIGIRSDRGKEYQPVDIYLRRRKRGDVRLRQILLAALSLGIDSPYLLGTSHHLKKAQIVLSSRSTIEHALAELDQRWVLDLAQ